MLRNVRTKKRNGVKFAFALVILSAAIFVMACGVSFAKNLSSSSGGDNARVSVLIMDARGSSSDNLMIDCGQGFTKASYNLVVTNTKDGKTAELSFKYDVIVRFNEALPEGIAISVDKINGTVSSDRKTVTISDVGRFTAGTTQTREHTMVFSVVNANFLLRDYVFKNVNVSVRAEQIY